MAETAQFEAVDRADGGELAPGVATHAAKASFWGRFQALRKINGALHNLGPFGSFNFLLLKFFKVYSKEVSYIDYVRASVDMYEEGEAVLEADKKARLIEKLKKLDS